VQTFSDALTTADALLALAHGNVAASTRRLLNAIASHDHSGALAEVRAAQNP
jgi:hypothetical protein